MTTAALLGGLAGAGVWLIAIGLRPRPRPIAVVLAELNRPATERIAHRGSADGWTRTALRVAGVVGTDTPGLWRDLALLGRSRGRHASDKLASAAAAFAAVALLAGLAFVGGATPPPTLIVAVAVGAGAAGYLVPDVLVRRDARRRRDEFRHALAAYLDLVAAAMAGGAHANQALHSVAELSDTDTFLALRRCLEAARRANTSPWAALAAFGTERALTDLEELTASLALVEHDGALVRESLGAKARSMRDRELADAQTQAETASERMSIPTVLLMAGFVALVGYPALSRVLTL